MKNALGYLKTNLGNMQLNKLYNAFRELSAWW